MQRKVKFCNHQKKKKINLKQNIVNGLVHGVITRLIRIKIGPN